MKICISTSSSGKHCWLPLLFNPCDLIKQLLTCYNASQAPYNALPRYSVCREREKGCHISNTHRRMCHFSHLQMGTNSVSVKSPVDGHKARRGRRLYSNPALSKPEQGSCYCPWNDLVFRINQVAFILGKLRMPFKVCLSCETFLDTQSLEMASPCSDS